MKPSPMMNKVGSGPMQLTGPLSNQAPPYVRCYTPSSNNTNTVGQAIASPTDYQIILKFVLLSVKQYLTKCELYTTTIKQYKHNWPDHSKLWQQ